MKLNKRLVGKIVVAAICAAVLIWTNFQERAIAREAENRQYGAYSTQSAIGEYQQVEVTALVPIGTEYNTASNAVVAVYCAAFKDGDSAGVVKIGMDKLYIGDRIEDGCYADAVEEAYKDWIVEDLTVLYSANQKESLVIRGKTVQMPEFSVYTLDALDIFTGSYDQEKIDQRVLLNEQLKDIPLLDATVSDSEETETYGLLKLGAGFLLVVAAVPLCLELYFMIRNKKREAKNEE